MIHVAFSPDDNYVMPTMVAITSLLENSSEDVTIHLLYIDGCLKSNNLELFRRTVDNYNAIFNAVSIPYTMLEGYPKLRHGLSAYNRILTPYLLPQLNKILYLDGDVVVEKSLSDLYHLDLDGVSWAAVADLKPFFTPGYVETIGFDQSNHPYVNSGVMLLNLDELRKNNINEKVQAYLHQYKQLIYHEDQDILNCCCNNVVILPPKYNSIIHLWTKRIDICKKCWNDEEIIDAKQSPYIVHYLGGFKPWKYEVVHPFKNRWYFYLNKTELKGWRPRVTFRKLISHIKALLLFHFR